MGRIRSLWILLGLVLFAASISDLRVSADVIPSENECRPYIEKAIHELKNVETGGENDNKESTEGNDSIDGDTADDGIDSTEETGGNSAEDENQSTDDTKSQENQTIEENASIDEADKEEIADDDSKQQEDSKESDKSTDKDDDDSKENDSKTDGDSKEAADDDDGDSKEKVSEDSKEEKNDKDDSIEKDDFKDSDSNEQSETESQDVDDDSKENPDGADSKENITQENAADDNDNDSAQTAEEKEQLSEEPAESTQVNDDGDSAEKNDSNTDDSAENGDDNKTQEQAGDEGDSKEKEEYSKEDDAQDDTKEDESVEEKVRQKRSLPDEANDTAEDDNDSKETANDSNANDSQENTPDDNDSKENDAKETADDSNADDSQENATDDNDSKADDTKENADDSKEDDDDKKSDEADDDDDDEEEKDLTIEDLTMEFEIPKNLRPREHVSDLLGLDAESSIKENALKRTGEVVLKELKKIFDNAIKPLETMYKYRDLSNRHFGDPEIFSKPLILFMGPWSGGKSTILNYLTDNEYTPNSIRSGAEPSPAYFNILMHGDEPEVLDGTQLAADWTFSGLQKFGQGLMDRLRGQKLPSKLLERVNIVEIPGILEVRKQVSRYFPFNDACQWFIDRADIIILVYDPSKLDAGPETEAILDQLKGREYQTRIILNKADQVKPEELLRVQGALIWNISPLMSSAQPPVMYTVSLWSHPFENGAPIRLLQAQERAFLTDLREAIDKRIENKIASARRFAVRIRNHAKMVDCYLTTYYNQKGLFSNKKNVADKIIEHPQNYNIYEGLSTLTNISRYDLPDPEVYLDFFRLNPLYEFKKLSSTCTYFKGCPINKLDIAIAYDLPELVGKYKKLLEQNLIELRKEYDENCNQTETEPPVKIIKSR